MYPLRCLVSRRSRIAENNAVEICLRRVHCLSVVPRLVVSGTPVRRGGRTSQQRKDLDRAQFQGRLGGPRGAMTGRKNCSSRRERGSRMYSRKAGVLSGTSAAAISAVKQTGMSAKLKSNATAWAIRSGQASWYQAGKWPTCTLRALRARCRAPALEDRREEQAGTAGQSRHLHHLFVSAGCGTIVGQSPAGCLLARSA